MAALDDRNRTGRGQHIDVSQYESGLQFLAPIILDYEVNGTVAHRNGNRDPAGAPHGAYPCKGDDNWCVISVFSEQEWESLCRAMGNPAWALDERYSTHEARKQNEDELDRRIGLWTSGFTPPEVVEQLQAAGVHAGVVNKMSDLYSDPQLTHRRQWIEIEHPEIGTMQYQSPPFILTKNPSGPDKRDPLLGEHNDYFYKEILGLSEQQYRELVDEEVIH